jgi:hypothetical protein
MVKRVIAILELLCLLGALLFSVLWVREPNGNYDPIVTLCGSAAVVLDALRRYMRSMKLRVFLSVGATYTKAQEAFVAAFERLLADSHCERLVVGRDCLAARQPILQARDLLWKADAVVVLAFTRFVVASAVEKPGADRAKHKATAIQDVRYPTVWNQIEAAMAFGLGRPLLTVIEEGIKQEAMLKDRHEFRTIVSPLDPDLFDSEEFKRTFEDFVRIARKRSWLRL